MMPTLRPFLSPLRSVSIRALALAAAALLVTGCASLNRLDSEVSTYGPWPADRKPDTFAFERLPSQQARPERQQMLEDAARGAVESAGFRAAADAGAAAYLLQVGARVSTDAPWIYNEPLFWNAGFAFRRGFGPRGFGPRGFIGAGWGPGWPYDYYYSPTFEREVALLIRDRKTGQLLYEARAANSGPSPSIDRLLPAMFEAALKDFPSGGPNPRNVTVQLSKE